tara:strand:- start:1197 stop:1772 length:576 start_codon:yes stop_codon:yes gene_type:complete
MKDKYKEDNTDVNDKVEVEAKYDWLLTMHKELRTKNIELKNERDELYDNVEHFQHKYETNKALYQSEVLLRETKEIREIGENTDHPVIEVKNYPKSDKRYENIMSHMNILWHKGKTGSDGCRKCDSYRNIFMSAFDKVERMSSRNISQDFSTTHINDDEPSVDDNNNMIKRVDGEIIGGDKDYDDIESYRA